MERSDAKMSERCGWHTPCQISDQGWRNDPHLRGRRLARQQKKVSMRACTNDLAPVVSLGTCGAFGNECSTGFGDNADVNADSRARALLRRATILVVSLGVVALTLSPTDVYAANCACSADAVHYTADTLPEIASPAWTPFVTEGATSVVNAGGVLHINSTSSLTDVGRFRRNWDGTNAEGVTIEARMKLNDYIGNVGLGGSAIWVEDDVSADVLIIEPDGIHLYASGLSAVFPTNDGFHRYRITAKDDDILVYVDGQLAIDGRGHFGENWWMPRSMIAFGDSSHGASSDSSWDYVRYSRCVWDVEYSAESIPTFSTPTWTAAQSAASVVTSSSGELQIDTLYNTSLTARYSRSWNMAQSASVSARVRLDAYTGDTNLGGTAMWIESGTRADVLLIRPQGVIFYGSGLSYDFPTMDQFHEYCIDADGPDILVYVDGQLAINGTGQFQARWWNPRNWVGFGDHSAGASSRSSWDFVRYSLDP